MSAFQFQCKICVKFVQNTRLYYSWQFCSKNATCCKISIFLCTPNFKYITWSTWWTLFQKCVMRTTLDIYVLILLYIKWAFYSKNGWLIANSSVASKQYYSCIQGDHWYLRNKVRLGQPWQQTPEKYKYYGRARNLSLLWRLFSAYPLSKSTKEVFDMLGACYSPKTFLTMVNGHISVL